MYKKTIKIGVFSFLLSTLLAFVPVSVRTNAPTHSDLNGPCGIENRTFEVGEEIVYKLYYNWNFVWLSAGEVTFRVDETDGKYHLTAEGRTYSSYEWFFKVRDYYESIIDKNTLLPTQAVRDVHEGDYTLYDKVVFDQKRKRASSLRGKTKEKATWKEYNLNGCTHDVLSVIYYARNIRFNHFEEGHTFPVNVFMDKEIYPLQVKYLGKEDDKKIKGLGRFNTIKFSPEVVAGEVFDEDTDMTVWVSDDQNRIPLLIESPVSVGSVKAVLKSYNGLKYNLDAKVK